ncbi:MAG: fasciclin domain-containing protein [Pseudomonadota bacterium]
MTTTKLTLAAAATAFFTAGQAVGQAAIGGVPMSADNDIVTNLAASPINKTLVAAVGAAGLVETLQGDGPFTVFAPLDSAFAALPEGTVESLLEEENKELLTTILTCHVLGADANYFTVRKGIMDNGGSLAVETLGGCVLTATMAGHRIVLTDENGTEIHVLVPDVFNTNGTIHAINGVILPASDEAMADEEETAMADKEETTTEAMAEKTIVDIAVGSGVHNTLVAAVQAADLVDTLAGEGAFTVFAPTDDAFGKLPEGTVENLVEPDMKDTLTTILTCHVVGAEVMSTALIGLIEEGGGTASVETLGGCVLEASLDGDMVKITDENGGVSTVTAVDLDASNGVVHVIDTVILPKG